MPFLLCTPHFEATNPSSLDLQIFTESFFLPGFLGGGKGKCTVTKPLQILENQNNPQHVNKDQVRMPVGSSLAMECFVGMLAISPRAHEL